PFGKVICQTRSKTFPSQFGGFETPSAFATFGIFPWCQQISTTLPAYEAFCRIVFAIFVIAESLSAKPSSIARLTATDRGVTVSTGRLLCFDPFVAKMKFGCRNRAAFPFNGTGW